MCEFRAVKLPGSRLTMVLVLRVAVPVKNLGAKLILNLVSKRKLHKLWQIPKQCQTCLWNKAIQDNCSLHVVVISNLLLMGIIVVIVLMGCIFTSLRLAKILTLMHKLPIMPTNLCKKALNASFQSCCFRFLPFSYSTFTSDLQCLPSNVQR